MGLSRFKALQQVQSAFGDKATYFITTGKMSREFLLNNISHLCLFPCVGGMGHVSSIAYSYALLSRKLTLCLDGDGSFLMHLGAISSFDKSDDLKFVHVILDNQMHQSVGGGRTNSEKIDFESLAKAFSYDSFFAVDTVDAFNDILRSSNWQGKHLIHVRINDSEIADLPRPKSKLIDFLHNFEVNW